MNEPTMKQILHTADGITDKAMETQDDLQARLSRYETAMREALALAHKWIELADGIWPADARLPLMPTQNEKLWFVGARELRAHAKSLVLVLDRAALSDQPAEDPAESKLEAR